MAPSAVAYTLGARAPTWERALVRVHPTGKVTVYTGAASTGQGHDTTFAQLTSAELGVPVEDIEIIHGDTDKVQMGVGTFGSRSVVVGGSAIRMSTDKIKEKAKRVAANLLEAARDVGLPVASACGADGICGRCGLEIVEGAQTLAAPSARR